MEMHDVDCNAIKRLKITPYTQMIIPMHISRFQSSGHIYPINMPAVHEHFIHVGEIEPELRQR